MQLPKYVKKVHIKLKTKICQEIGCGKEFMGHQIAKYCPAHRDSSNRKKRRKIYEDIELKNQIIKHNYNEVMEIEFPCALKGCCNSFKIKIYPKQYIYPKFCEDHRTEHRRMDFLRRHL